MLVDAIKHSLGKLTVFEGRDARQTFWFYVLFLVIVQFLIGMLLSVPMMIGVFAETISAVQTGAEPEAMSARFIETMIGYMEAQLWGSIALGMVVAALLVTSFVRRLHDAGFSGWIAAIPLVSQVFSLSYSVYVFDQVVDLLPQAMQAAASGAAPVNPMALQAEVAPLSLMGWIGYLVVIGFGVLKSQDGPNKYGEEPGPIG